MSSIDPIDLFNQGVEYGKYVTFAPYYVKEHLTDIQKSIDGEFDKERTLWNHRNIRGSEHLDIEWSNFSNSVEVYNEALWSSVKHRFINLKVCIEAYGKGIGIDKKNFYPKIKNALSLSKFTVPNGQTDSPLEILRNSRNIFAHDSDPKRDAYRASFGMTDIRSFLMTDIFYFDDGKEQRIASYDNNNSYLVLQRHLHFGLLDYETGSRCLYDILEEEMCNSINAFDAIFKGRFADENDCIVQGFWRPITFV